jgi:hypothetical protein
MIINTLKQMTMKAKFNINIILMIICISLAISCEKFDPVSVTKFCNMPQPSAVSYTSASVTGELMDINGEISCYGHCWADVANPDISNFKTEFMGTPFKQTGFPSTLRALIPGRKYYVRTYAKTGSTVIYSNEISFTTTTVPSNKVVDCDDNLYDTVKIGTQIWMKSNLKVTHFNDGSEIPLVTQNSAWVSLTTAGYCWSNNDELLNKNTYGHCIIGLQ